MDDERKVREKFSNDNRSIDDPSKIRRMRIIDGTVLPDNLVVARKKLERWVVEVRVEDEKGNEVIDYYFLDDPKLKNYIKEFKKYLTEEQAIQEFWTKILNILGTFLLKGFEFAKPLIVFSLSVLIVNQIPMLDGVIWDNLLAYSTMTLGCIVLPTVLTINAFKSKKRYTNEKQNKKLSDIETQLANVKELEKEAFIAREKLSEIVANVPRIIKALDSSVLKKGMSNSSNPFFDKINSLSMEDYAAIIRNIEASLSHIYDPLYMDYGPEYTNRRLVGRSRRAYSANLSTNMENECAPIHNLTEDGVNRNIFELYKKALLEGKVRLEDINLGGTEDKLREFLSLGENELDDNSDSKGTR